MPLEQKYAPRAEQKRELWSMKMTPKLKYLARIAAQAEGKSLSSYVESALEKSFASIVIVDEREANVGKTGGYVPVHGKTLAELADSLYQGTEANRFLALVNTAPWLLSDGESKLLRILQHSDYFAPSYKGFRILHDGRIQQHWTMLAAIRDGEADIDILPEAHRPSEALAFGLLGDKERIALYKSDPAKFKAQSEAYKKAMKGGK